MPSHLLLSLPSPPPHCHTYLGRQWGHSHSAILGHCTWWLLSSAFLYILAGTGNTWLRHCSWSVSQLVPQRAARYPRWRNFASNNTGMECLLFLKAHFFFNQACLLVLTSITMKERVLLSMAANRSRIGKMFVPWKYGAYLPTLSFSCSSAVLLLIDQEMGIAGLLLSAGFGSPGWIELSVSDVSCDTCETGSAGHSVGIGIGVTGCSGSLWRVSKSLVFKNRSKDEFLLSSSIVAWWN